MNPDLAALILFVGLAMAVAGEIHVFRHRTEREKGQRNGHDEPKRRPPGP